MSTIATRDVEVGLPQAARRPRRTSDGRSRAQVISAALLTLAAGAIHFGVAPGHLTDHPVYGVFFIGLGLVQVGLAVTLLVGARRRLFIGAAAGTAAVISLWLASRTIGLPLAPEPWSPEPVGFTDVVATLLEAISLLLFLLLIRAPRRPRHRGRIRVALSTAPAFLLAGLLGFLGVGAGLSPMAAAFSAAPSRPGLASISVANLVALAGGEPLKAFTLTAGITTVGGKPAWAYNGTVPGPELRVSKGDRVMVTLVNHLTKPTTIHWHGVRLPNAQDGVAGLTQDAVPPGSSFTYEFVANDAGTFWYHSHQDPADQIARGLLGALIVTPKGGVAELRDYSLLVHNLNGSDAIGVNGIPSAHLAAKPGETVRLRLINGVVPGFDGAPLTPVLLGAPYRITALDGHDLNEPQVLGPQRIPIGMGQRADLVFTMPAEGAARLTGMSGAAPLLPWSRASSAGVTIGDGPPPAAVDATRLPRFDLTSYGTPALDPVADSRRFDVSQKLVLDGRPGFRNGSFDFMDTFTGAASPYAPPIRVQEGDLVHLHISNASPKWHPIHIHGHVFSVLARNARPLTGSPVHVDAVLVAPTETWDVAFKADNPGIWMLHCHVLAHAAAGMSMTINYEGISTPFTMGPFSGNIPE